MRNFQCHHSTSYPAFFPPLLMMQQLTYTISFTFDEWNFSDMSCTSVSKGIVKNMEQKFSKRKFIASWSLQAKKSPWVRIGTMHDPNILFTGPKKEMMGKFHLLLVHWFDVWIVSVYLTNNRIANWPTISYIVSD